MSRMRSTRLLVYVGLTLLAGCATTSPADNAAASSQPASQPDEAGPLSLRTAMLPRDEPQSFHIRLHEKRETTQEGVSSVVHELHVELGGTLSRVQKEGRPNAAVHAVVTLDRIHVRYQVSQPSLDLHYDSESDA